MSDLWHNISFNPYSALLMYLYVSLPLLHICINPHLSQFCHWSSHNKLCSRVYQSQMRNLVQKNILQGAPPQHLYYWKICFLSIRNFCLTYPSHSFYFIRENPASGNIGGITNTTPYTQITLQNMKCSHAQNVREFGEFRRFASIHARE